MIEDEDELLTSPAAEIETEEDDGSSAGGKRVSEEIWALIAERYGHGTATMDELAKEYGVSRQSISRKMKKLGVTHSCKAHELRAAVSAGVKATIVAKAKTYADQRSDWVETARTEGIKGLAFSKGLAAKLVKDCLTSGASVASIDDDLKALQRYQKLLIDNTMAQLGILNADKIVDEMNLPTVILRDVTDQEIEAVQNGDEENDDEEIEEEAFGATLDELKAALPA